MYRYLPAARQPGPTLADAEPGEPVQFERQGFFASTPIRSRTAWSSTAPSDYEIAGPRRK
jgi:hypothetical protein